jgi:uncharacterized protein (TIGR02285 family)
MHTTGWKGVDTIASLWLTIMMVTSLVLPPSAQAQEKETITWGIIDFPTAFIVEGPEAGTGICDQLQSLMMEQLEGYTHTTELFPNFSRIRHLMMTGEQMCTSAWMYRPPGHVIRQTLTISMPSGLFFSHHLIVRQEDRHLFGEEVSLDDLLQNTEAVLGVQGGAGYSAAVSEVLSRYAGVEDIWTLDAKQQVEALNRIPNLYVHTGSQRIRSLINMLMAERVAYLFLQPHSAMYEARRLGIEDQLAIIPVKENRSEIGVLAYACPKTEWGEKIIAEINTILETHRDTPAYKQLMESQTLGRDEVYWSFWEENVLSVHE